MNLSTKISSSLSKTLLTALTVGSFFSASAKEGMWLPPTLKAREQDMIKMGLRIPIEQLYNTNGTGLNNAVVLFGGGCTGEIISPKGLLLTNHHCGYSTAQKLSTVQNDFFANGFWAKNINEELPCPGLTVTFIRKMENVTDRIIFGLSDTMQDASRDSIISVRIKALEKGYAYTTKMDARIQPYFRSNQFWVIVSETYRDIRFVGFPPNGIGNFGGDTDNWMWPRHNADFSMFRVYADANGKPVDYKVDNKPYNTTKNFFKINISGIKEGDFTMVYGFPGTTQEYIAASQLKQIETISDPVRIEARTRKLAIWKAAMDADRDVFIKYTSKRATIANGWKKWQGEVRGLGINNVNSIKLEREKAFQEWAVRDTNYNYADNVLAEIQATTTITNNALRAEEYIREAVFGVELVAQAAELDAIVRMMRKSNDPNSKAFQDAKSKWQGFYKNYDAATDRKVFISLMPLFIEKCPDFVPRAFKDMLARSGGSYEQWAANVFSSPVTNADWLNENFDTLAIQAMPVYQMYRAIAAMRNEKVLPVLRNYNERMTRLNRLYMAAQMKARPEGSMYPDANLTLRLTYGKVKGIDPDGPAGYSFQTNLDEVIAKDQPAVEEFRVPQLLKDLHANKNYGRWAVKGTVPVAFIADNHTSGGNSGSPVINAKGELIGTNFDRIWEGTMSDLYFDPNLCRNISVDIRYTLFLVEKFGGAGWLLKEMKLVKN